MRIYCLILALLLAVGEAFASSRRSFVAIQPSAAAAVWNPTNNPDGVWPNLWLVGDYSVTTNQNGNITNWTDITTNAFVFITNGISEGPFYTNTVKTHAAVTFTKALSHHLFCTSYTNEQPSEYWLVIYQPEAVSAQHGIFDGWQLTGQFLDTYFSTPMYYMNAGTDAFGPGGVITGSWLMLSVLFDGAGSVVFTNAVTNFVANAGADDQMGIRLGKDNGDVYGGYSLAEMMGFSPALSATYRNSLSNYLWVKYLAP